MVKKNTSSRYYIEYLHESQIMFKDLRLHIIIIILLYIIYIILLQLWNRIFIKIFIIITQLLCILHNNTIL